MLDAVRDLGYRPSGPARALAGSRTRMLGLIMSDLSQPFYAELTQALESAAREKGYTMVLANGAGDTDREAMYLDLLAERRVDGILVASWGITARHVAWLVGAPVEVVLVSCKAPGVPLPAIVASSRQGVQLAAEHLIGLGHRRLGEITGPPDSAAAIERHAGLLEALSNSGSSLIELAVAHSAGDFESGRVAAADLLGRVPRPTALICYNDLVAAGAIKAANSAGLEVPGDVSIVGFDDVTLASMVEPALTTVAQSVDKMGRWAVERMVAQIAAHDAGEASPAAEIVNAPCHLVVRDSTAVAPEP